MSNEGGRIERTGESEEGEGGEGNEEGRRKRGKGKERRKERKGSGGDVPLQNLASDKAALQEKDTVLKFHSSHFIHLSLVLFQLEIAECTIGIHPVVVRAGGRVTISISYFKESKICIPH